MGLKVWWSPCTDGHSAHHNIRMKSKLVAVRRSLIKHVNKNLSMPIACIM